MISANNSTLSDNVEYPIDSILNEILYNMVRLEGGTFKQLMQIGNDIRNILEVPVTLSPFYISKYQVTQRQWFAIMGNNPSFHRERDLLPVDRVSWFEAIEFCEKLRDLTGKNFCLPTLSQWRFAAQGRKSPKDCLFIPKEIAEEYGWNKMNSMLKTHPVGQKKPNEYGLYDIIGNVKEWCNDWSRNTVNPWLTEMPKKPLINPLGPPDGGIALIDHCREVCGSSYWTEGSNITANFTVTPDSKMFDIGVRLAISGDDGTPPQFTYK